MKLSKIGEFGLINRLSKQIKLDSSVIKGPGDDCAVVSFSKDKYMLMSCDMIIEGVDFKSSEDPYLIGRKAVAVSISDIAACAGIPRYCLVSLGLPGNKKTGFTDRLFKGIRGIINEFKINLVGGDLSSSDKVVIDVSILGIVDKNKLVLRSTAKTGDMVFVTGSLGGSIRGKHLKFIPRIKEAQYLVKNFKINSMIDVSDGLIQDLTHILTESGKSAVIYEGLIPLNKDSRGIDDALYSGEDFELLFTLSAKDAGRLIKSGDKRFSLIGRITSGSNKLRLISAGGAEKKVLNKGFRHF